MTVPSLVLPTEIPWERLKAGDLEETLFWLLEALGAKDLEWRRGGKGQGAADQGRDLQATFQVSAPDGAFEAQRWWVEAKGRGGSVERRAVQRAVDDASVRDDVDVLVVATNTTFTNAVRDWIAAWNGSRRRPTVKLWDREALEKMLSRQPSVVARLFSDALSVQGRLVAVRDRFWNNMAFASSGTLEKLWDARNELEYDDRAVVALIASEYANGSPAVRRWTEAFETDDVVALFALSLRNLMIMLERATAAGVSQDPLLRTVGHALVVTLRDAGTDAALRSVDETLVHLDGTPWEGGFVDYILLGVCSEMMNEFLGPCVEGCRRVSIVGTGAEPKPYWYRFRKGMRNEEPTGKRNEHDRLLFFNHSEPCAVGFPENRKDPCPLVPEPDDVRAAFGVLERIVRVRIPAEPPTTAGNDDGR